ncbi:heavy metal translocating P-type ATPase [Craterilacuibacter sp.]|uniref:heavy metal translocating P-type ATPase n=1 Tax=Craterilacuibacter sp. TaxID=2870909 RepID=UPI003F31BB5D
MRYRPIQPPPRPQAAPAACCSGACHTSPDAPPAPDSPLPAGHIRSRLRIAQMDCPVEEALLRKRLGTMTGVAALEFNLMARVLTVVHLPVTLDAIIAAIADIGMHAQTMDETTPAAAPSAPKTAWWPLAAAGLLALFAELAHALDTPALLAALLALAAIGLCGLTTYKKGWLALRHGQLNINALMSIAVTGAALIGQWPEAAMVMVLFTLAERIEVLSLDRARRAVQGLMQLSPQTATVQDSDGQWREQSAAGVEIGRQVRVKPGERIALDGVVTAGQSSVDQAPITGESLPQEKSLGDTLFAGTINQHGALEYRVSARADNSTLARIVHAIEQAQGARAPMQRFIDRFARIYTPVIFALALAVALLPPLLLDGSWHDWIYKALVLLVIACPCALVISTPVTIVSALTAAARAGILIKGGVFLEAGRRLKFLALDKTGTLTHGKPVLTDSVFFSGQHEASLRHIALSLAARSDHPASAAIARALDKDQIPYLDVTNFSALPGVGIRGTLNGRIYTLSQHRLLHEQALCCEAIDKQIDALEQQGKSVTLLADAENVLALFAMADTLKDGSRAAISELHALGIKTVMLSGDNIHTARAIAAAVGIDDVRGELLPEDKLDAVAAYAAQGVTGMVGDGINDAPALARADIGFAMGAAGTDTAIETADVALMDDDLAKLPAFIRLSRRCHAVLVQNIVLALGIKAVFLALTLAGLGTMWMAVFADMGASLLVIANGLRLLRKRG